MKHQTPDSMKFRKLARRLGLRLYEAVGVLELLWLVTQKNAPRGDIGRYDNEEIAIALDWAGDPDELVATLVDCGWLDESREHRLIVHDWHEHAPRYVHGVVAKSGGFVTTVADYSEPLQSATTVGDCSEGQPNLTKPNLTKPEITPSELFPDDAAEPASPEAGSGIVFPVVAGPSDKRKTWELPQPLLDSYRECYGEAVNVEQEIRHAKAWLEASPKRRKTRGGMQRFLTSWLMRRVNGTPPSPQFGGGGGRRHTEITPL